MFTPPISLSLAIVAFPIGEVIGSLLFADLAEILGRKQLLQFGFLGSIGGMSLLALSLWIGYFPLFLLAQLITGFFAGKQALAQAGVVESGQRQSQGKRLAFLSVIGGVAWILGPIWGHWLMDHALFGVQGLIWPSLFCVSMFVLGLCCLRYSDCETPEQTPAPSFHLGKSLFQILWMGWKEKIFFVLFLNLLGWYLLAISLSDF